MLGLAAVSGLALEPHHLTAPGHYRYASTVFVTEPWPEAYVQNDERRASFERATRSYAPTVDAYIEAGYSTCVIPKVSVQARVAFILDQVARMMRLQSATTGQSRRGAKFGQMRTFSMNSRLRLGISFVVVAAALAAAGVWLSRELSIDRCLDQGGAWDHEQTRCVFAAR